MPIYNDKTSLLTNDAQKRKPQPKLVFNVKFFQIKKIIP